MSGRFEISENDSMVATGCMSCGKKSSIHMTEGKTNDLELNVSHFNMSSKDVYRELSLSGFEYGSNFQGICCVNNSG